jgi:DNA replication and repair protein RecF
MISRYARVLRQRNQLLETGAPQEIREPFDRQWAELSLKIMKEREAYLQELLPIWQARLDSLTQSHSPLAARWDGRLKLSHESDEESLLKALLESRDEEFRYRKTVLGPNRDDLTVWFGRRQVREVGSQGQQRMLVIALKLAEADLFYQRTGNSPVFLLDDIGSELDPGHLGKLLAALGEIQAQTILTSAQSGSFDSLHAPSCRVQKGKLISKSKG